MPFLPSNSRTSASASPRTYTWGSRTVERRTLRSQLPSIFDILANMFRVIELQEPTFQEVRPGGEWLALHVHLGMTPQQLCCLACWLAIHIHLQAWCHGGCFLAGWQSQPALGTHGWHAGSCCDAVRTCGGALQACLS